ncbi:hypothetical protein MMC25_004882 [Agyrium rufum]|nr:hypothetical protein [Agyrium rufum]
MLAQPARAAAVAPPPPPPPPQQQQQQFQRQSQPQQQYFQQPNLDPLPQTQSGPGVPAAPSSATGNNAEPDLDITNDGPKSATPLACTACREKHLKCDGRTPPCSRCETSGQTCIYVKSRRGWRPREKKKEPQQPQQIGTATFPQIINNTNDADNYHKPASSGTTLPSSNYAAYANHHPSTTGTSDGSSSTSSVAGRDSPNTHNQLISNATALHAHGQQHDQHHHFADPLYVIPGSFDGYENLDALYHEPTDFYPTNQVYQNIYDPSKAPLVNIAPLDEPIHHIQNTTTYIPMAPQALVTSSPPPASIPVEVNRSLTVKENFLSKTVLDKLRENFYTYFHHAHPVLPPKRFLRENPTWRFPAPLEAVVSYIGASYSDRANLPFWQARVEAALAAQQSFFDAYTVQAKLLLALAYHAHALDEEAEKTLSEAVDHGLNLGMHKPSFARRHNEGYVVLEESWRRTWWELFVMDGLFAAFHQRPSFRLNQIKSDVGLPSEEADYEACQPMTHPQKVDEMQDSIFADVVVTFSSYAYRISAVYELGRLLKLNENFVPNNNDIAIAGDAALSSWLLNLPDTKREPTLPNGDMDEMLFQAHMVVNAASVFLHRPRSSLIFTSVNDTTRCTPARRLGAPTYSYGLHTAKAVAAADRIANLITLPGPILNHTPFATCMLTLGAVVHLSAYVLTPEGKPNEAQSLKELLGLEVGALKAIGATWNVAGAVMERIKGASREVLQWKKQPVYAAAQEQEEVGRILGTGWHGVGQEGDGWLEHFPESYLAANGNGNGVSGERIENGNGSGREGSLSSAGA